MSDETGMTIDVLRHSAAHLLAHAVLDLYPETKTGIGPAVETGYYYDFLREKGQAAVTVFREGPFADFCLGPHVPSTGALQHVKLLSVSGAYWKGDERGPQMQRIYGTVSFSKKELEDHLRLLEEAKKRDHRRLGAELDLYSTNDELGGGLILWPPQGAPGP